MAFDNALLSRYVQKFIRSGTSLFLRTYNRDTDVVVDEYEISNSTSGGSAATHAGFIAAARFASLTGAIAQPSDTVLISANVSIDLTNFGLYNGRVLELSAAFTVTITAGLPDNFGFALIPPTTGNASIAFTGTTGNGASTTITKAASDVMSVVVQRNSSRNAYVVK